MRVGLPSSDDARSLVTVDAVRGRNQRLAHAWAKLTDPTVAVVSTDVFDTLLWRRVPQPVDAFPLIGQRLQAAGLLSNRLSAEAFGMLRERAEQRVRARRLALRGQSEITLAAIYAAIPDWVFGTPLRRAAVEVEVSVEREILVPDLDVLDLLLAAQEQGRRIVAVSDTYYSARHLRNFFNQPLVSRLGFAAVFASSDHGVNKSGGLFEIAVKQLGIRPWQMLHLGDNAAADVKFPGKLGISPALVRRHPPELEEVLRRERRIELPRAEGRLPERDLLDGDFGLSGLRGKVAARTGGATTPSLAALWSYGASVLGPVLVGFAEWVVRRAEERGTDRVFYTVRERPPLAELIDAAAESIGSPVRTRALSTDRDTRAWACEGPAIRSEATVGNGGRPEDVARHVQREALTRGVVTLVDLTCTSGLHCPLTKELAQAQLDVQLLGLHLGVEPDASEAALNGLEPTAFFRSRHGSKLRLPPLIEELCMVGHTPQVGVACNLQSEPTASTRSTMTEVERDALWAGVTAFQRERARYERVLPGRLGSLAEADHILLPVLLRSITWPTTPEALALSPSANNSAGNWMPRRSRPEAEPVPAVRYLDAATVAEMAGNNLHSPWRLAASIHPDFLPLLRAATDGRIRPDAICSSLESGPFEVAVTPDGDHGQPPTVRAQPRRNWLGLSHLEAKISAPQLNRIELRPATDPCVLRVDQLTFRLGVQGSEPIVATLATGSQLRRLPLREGRWIAPNVLMVRGASSCLLVDLRAFTNLAVDSVEVECVFAALPLTLVGGSDGLAPPTASRHRLLSSLARVERLLRRLSPRAASHYRPGSRPSSRRARRQAARRGVPKGNPD